MPSTLGGYSCHSLICNLCKENLIVKYGLKPSSVPLFSATTNKEFCSAFGVGQIILSDRLLAVGIGVMKTQEQGGSICKRCARKIVNCCKTYKEIRDALSTTSSVNSTPKRKTKRITSARTPTGITPTAKRPKPVKDSTYPVLSSKKQLFGSEQSTRQSAYDEIDDHISSLMNLPADTTLQTTIQPPLVKVFVGYPASSRVLERSCEDRSESCMVKYICKGDYRPAANAALRFPPFRRELVKELIRLLRKELKTYSQGPSVSKYNGNPLSLSEYTSESLLEEAEVNLPVLTEIIKGLAKSGRSFTVNKQALTLSSILNTWIPRSNFVYRLNTLLIDGGCKTETMDLFHRIGLSSHPNTIRNQVQSCANHFDQQIVQWKDQIEHNLKEILFLEEILQRQTGSTSEDGMDLCSIDLRRESVSNYRYYDTTTFETCKARFPDTDILDETDVLQALSQLKNIELPRYRLVGDNLDIEQYARIQSRKKANKSIHWFHEYAVRDRVHANSSMPVEPQISLDELEMKEFLPTPDVQQELISDLRPQILRVLVDYLPAYKFLSGAVVYHIPHTHSKQMAEKSEVCCLGLDFHNSNMAAEMAVILENIQEKFVPVVVINEVKEILEKVILDGDQLTEERARNAKIANTHADSQYEQLRGLQTSFADWHLGKNLLDIFFKLFTKESSAAEIGTSYASMNRSGKTNARKGPEKDYNSYKDFFDRETEAHIVAAWMQFTGMTQLHDDPITRPIPSESATWTTEEKRKWLFLEIDSFLVEHMLRANELPEKIVQLDSQHREGFMCRSVDCEALFALHSQRVRHELARHPDLPNFEADNGDHNRDAFGYYKCRDLGCYLVFTTNATRIRHEKVQHQLDYSGNGEEGYHDNEKKEDKADKIFNYHSARLHCGFLFQNLIDAIKEGDGLRVVRCYKFVLLFEYKYRHTKYAYLLLHFFANIYSILSEKDAFLLIHNRFLNKKGGKGNNVPLDLHMEHLNLDLKKLLKSMGGKITEKASQRCARSLTVLNSIMDRIYNECDKQHRSGYHSNIQCNETVATIASDLVKGNVFHFTPGRQGYNSFKNFKENIVKFDYRDFFSWARNHFKQWKAIYEMPDIM